MKLVTIEAREVAGRPGVLLDGGVILDLSAAPGSLSASQWVPQSTISILAAGERGCPVGGAPGWRGRRGGLADDLPVVAGEHGYTPAY